MRYLVTGKQAAEIDRYTIEEIGVPQLVLMERASLAVAQEVENVVQDRKHDRILVVAEGGNNGGDGVAAARILHQRGYKVSVWALNGISRQSEAYRKQVELAEKAGVLFVNPVDDTLTGYRVIVDAIFGVGLTREVIGVQREAAEVINRARLASSELSVIAVDIPSGISSETGEVLGTAVKADRTVTFGFEKVGMRFAKEYCGEVSVYEIGFYLPENFGNVKDPNDKDMTYFTYDKEDIPVLLPHRSPEGNKGTYGRVLVIAGSEDIYGAAYLAAEAALRTGCGLVKVVTHENNRNAILQMLPEALISTWSEAEKDQCVAGTEGSDRDPAKVLEDDIRWASVILIGPGLGQTDTSKHFVETVLRKATCPVILDADAINILSEHTDWLTETAGQRPLILTPHMLEMTRLTWETLHPERSALDALKKERVEIAKKIAMRYRATVVLKDACTVVVDGNTGSESAYLNSSGNESMAKGGSGDVLTGMIAGLIAQGLSFEDAARLGVYVHGLTGDAARKKLGAYSVIARDLIDALSEVL